MKKNFGKITLADLVKYMAIIGFQLVWFWVLLTVNDAVTGLHLGEVESWIVIAIIGLIVDVIIGILIEGIKNLILEKKRHEVKEVKFDDQAEVFSKDELEGMFGI